MDAAGSDRQRAVCRHPVGPPAGQPEARAFQVVQPIPDVVERRPAILCAGARLVEPIQEENCVMPLRPVVEGLKVPDCDISAPRLAASVLNAVVLPAPDSAIGTYAAALA